MTFPATTKNERQQMNMSISDKTSLEARHLAVVRTAEQLTTARGTPPCQGRLIP